MDEWNILGKFRVKKVVAATFMVACIYSTSFFIQTTLLPYIVKELSIDTVQYGYLQTVFGVVQLVGGPIFGQLCDSLGLKVGMVLALGSTFACYLITFAAWDFWSLLLSRLMCVFMHGIQGAQTVLAGVTEGQERTIVFSRMGVVFGLGFVLGPGSAGLLSRYFGYRIPILLAAALCLIAIALVVEFIPNRSIYASGEERKSFDIGSYRRVLQYPGVLRVFIIKYLTIIPLILLSTIVGVYLLEKYKLTPAQNAVHGTYIGLWIAFMNGFGVVWLRQRFQELFLLKLGVFCVMFVNFCLAVLFTEYWHLYLFHPGMALGTSLVGIISDSRLTAVVPGTEHGTVLGFSHASNSLFRSVAPLIAGYMLQNLGFESFGYVGLVTCGIALGILTFTSDEHGKKDHEE